MQSWLLLVLCWCFHQHVDAQLASDSCCQQWRVCEADYLQANPAWYSFAPSSAHRQVTVDTVNKIGTADP
eukprot:6346032-Amphidinium_carterae.1